MKFPTTLKKAKFQKRYKRFFADIEYQKNIETAHVPNTGSLKSCLNENADCYVTFTDDPKRKLKYTLQMIKTKNSWVGVNTQIPNKIVRELFDEKANPSWKKFKYARNEIKIHDKTRIDLVLGNDPILVEAKKISSLDELEETGKKFHFIEVKNVTYAEGDRALFPDAVSTRALKHIEELLMLIERGHTCELVFTVQRNDCKSFSAAKEIDPKYAKALSEAKKKGLKVTALECHLDKKEISLIPIKKIKVL